MVYLKLSTLSTMFYSVLINLLASCAIAFSLTVLPTQSSIQLPTPTEYYSHLLNTTPEELPEIVDSFDFIDDSSAFADHVDLLLYPVDNGELAELQVNNLDLNKETKVLIHGWQNDGRAEWMRDIASDWNQEGNSQYNIILVDWQEDSMQNYLHAAAVVAVIGEVVGDKIVDQLVQGQLDRVKKLHIVGHSLGAHVAGFAGQRILERTQKKVARITGLDAAAPLFETLIFRPNQWKLDKSDADFVDFIHTDIIFLGVTLSYGSVDFYPNSGGPIQPACFDGPDDVYSLIACSHSYSQVYYRESILEANKFRAVSCPSATLFNLQQCKNNKEAFMGEHVALNASGRYYL